MEYHSTEDLQNKIEAALRVAYGYFYYLYFNLLFNCFISSRSLLFSFKTKSCSFVRRMCLFSSTLYLFSSVENNSFNSLSSLTKKSTFVVSNLYFYK